VRLPAPLAAALVSGALSSIAACGGGVFRDPISAHDAGAIAFDGGAAIDAATEGSQAPPRLPGNWSACGKMGTGGPGAIALSADAAVVAILFVEGQLVVQRVADQAKLVEIADAFGPPSPDFDPDMAPPPTQRFFQSHTLALAPDGSSVMVQDATHLAAWRIPSGEQLFDLAGSFARPVIDPSASTFVVFHGALFIDGSPATAVELRSLSDGSLVHQLDGANVTSIGFGAGGAQILMSRPRFAACGAQCGEIEAFDADSGALVGAALLAQDDPAAGRFSPKGRYFVGFAAPQMPGTPDELRVLDTTDGHRVASYSIDGDDLAFSPDESTVFTFYSSRTDMCCASIANIDTGDSQPAPQATSQTTAAALGPAGHPTFGLDRTGVYRTTDPWPVFPSPDYQPPARFRTLPGQGMSFMAATASPDGRWLATTSIDATSPSVEDVILWDLHARRGERVLTTVTAANVAFSPDGQRALLAGPRDGLTLDVTSLREWPLEADTADWAVGAERDTIRNAVYGSDGTHVVAALGSGIQAMRVGESTLSANIAVGEPFLAMALHPDGDRLAVSGPELWRVSDQRRIGPAAPGSPAAAPAGSDSWLAFSPDGSLLLTSDFQSTASPPWNSVAYPDARDHDSYTTRTRLYQVDDAGLTLVHDLGPGLPRRPVFSPDGAWILAGNVLFSLESQGSKTLPLSLGYLEVAISTFAPDGTIAIGREDGVIELFCPR